MPNPVKNRNELNVRYCDILGLDVERYAGFRLTVLTEHLPVLETFDMTQTLEDGGWAVERSVLVPNAAENGAVDPHHLNVAFCKAFGVDTQKHAGFRFTVLGGELPALESFVLPPTTGIDGRLSDEIAESLESLAASFHAAATDAVEAYDAADAVDVVPETTLEPTPERHQMPAGGGEAPRPVHVEDLITGNG
jgi:hypothetical protein